MSQRHDFRSALRQAQPEPPMDPRQRFFANQERPSAPVRPADLELTQEAEESEGIETFTTPPLIEWQVHETETEAPSRKLLFWLGLILMSIIGYALFVDSPIVAITFILIGLMGYLLLHKKPRFLQCRIFDQGISVNRELFPFEGMNSFWIFEDEHYPPFVRLHTKTLIEPLVDIPLGDTEVKKIHDILETFIPEERAELNLVDILSRMLHI
jgi:hypothetical protein